MNVKQLGRKALTPTFGRVRLQPFFEVLHETSLAGLNFGEGNHPAHSGERHVIETIARQVTRPVIFDVGANVGQYSHELLDVLGDQADIWAFEPSASSFAALDRALGGTIVRRRRLAFGDHEGAATLYSSGEEAKGASLYDMSNRMARFGMAVRIEETVDVQTIDGFCATEGIDRIDFLKLDVEGHELTVLRGAADMLERALIGAVQFEFAAANIDSRTFFRDFFYLLNDRYRIHRVLQNGLWPIDRYTESCEVFKRATNYLALRR